MQTYAQKGLELESDAHSVIQQFEDTSFYSCVSKTKCFIVGICSIVTLILASVSYSLLHSDIKLVKQTFDDWNLIPIQDVYVYSAGNFCPEGTELAWDQKWPGMNNGCYCSGNVIQTQLHGGQCSRKERRRGCYDVSGASSKLYQMFNGNVICIKRSTTLPRMINSKTTTNNQCDQGYKLCGAPSQDSSQRYCVENSQICPVNQMRVVHNNDIAYLNGYKMIPLQNGFTLGIGTNGAALPISQLKISQGVPCLNEQQYNRRSQKKIYKLQNTYEDCSTYNGYREDNRWTLLASTTEYQLLLENGIWNILSAKPEFQIQPQERSQAQSIYYRSYVTWSPLCRAGGRSISRLDITNDTVNLSSSVSSYLIGLIVLSAIFVAFGLFTLCLSCIRKCAPFSQIYILLIKGVVVIICGIMMSLYIKANMIIGDNQEPYEQMMSARCSDTLTNTLLSQLPAQINTTKTVNYVGGVFCAFLVLWQVIIYFVSWSKYGKPI